MKKYLFLVVLFVTIPAVAYKAGPSGRANFGAASQQQPAQGYRAFTNSNNQWRQGVQTKPVQTSMAGSAATEFAPADKKSVGKQTVATQPVAKPTATAAPAASQQPAEAPAMPANMDPTAMLQQVQGMMQGMNMMNGAATNGQPVASSGQQNSAPAMPAGMPDLSALMGGAIPTMPAASTPTKK